MSIGNEIMRIDHSKNDEVMALKIEFAKMYDRLIDKVLAVQKQMDTPPKITTPETINSHMEVIRVGEECLRCMSEASKQLELACMWAVKGITA